MEWIGILIGAVATLVVAVIGALATRSDSMDLERLTSARSNLGDTGSEATAEIIDASILIAAQRVHRRVSRRTNGYFVALCLLALALVVLVVSMSLVPGGFLMPLTEMREYFPLPYYFVLSGQVLGLFGMGTLAVLVVRRSFGG